MSTKLVYDWPTRLFHWLFVVLFLSAFAIAKWVDDESWVFYQHMLLGLTLSFLTLLRVGWGFVGSRYARFSSYPLSPRDLLSYLRGVLTNKGAPHLGHNPASAWSALIMMLLALSLGCTGFLMARGFKEDLEDLHELLANGFILVVGAHLLGLILHGFQHRDGLAMSMLHGRKRAGQPEPVLQNSHPWVGVLLVVVVVGFAALIYSRYDRETGILTFPAGVTLELGAP